MKFVNYYSEVDKTRLKTAVRTAYISKMKIQKFNFIYKPEELRPGHLSYASECIYTLIFR